VSFVHGVSLSRWACTTPFEPTGLFTACCGTIATLLRWPRRVYFGHLNADL
jgi:hypothetical protein